ncbi:MAG: glycosyltransferase family 39 protein [Anaerolineae bacterium]|nr:glycosyltransferase family 39 protein [Anaerolineae bacterium]
MYPMATGEPRNIACHSLRLLLLAIVALGAFLRLYQIGDNGLWIDEAFSIWMGQQPTGEMLGWLVRIDQHPPLYYLLLHLWMHLGDDQAVVRAFSALCSTLTIPAIYLLGRRLSGQKLGLLAALILAVSPFHVHFAQEARMYALMALNASLAMVALARLLTDPRAATVALGQQLVDFFQAWRTDRRRPPLHTIETDLAWLAYALFTAITLLTHNTAVFFPIAANLLVLGLFLVKVPGCQVPGCRLPQSPISNLQPQTSNLNPNLFLRNWLLAQAATFLLWSPWLSAFIKQSVGIYREFWLPEPTWAKVGEVLLGFVSEFLPLPLGAIGVIVGLYAGLAALGLVTFRRRRTLAAFLLTLFAVPFVGELLVSLRRPIFYGRTLIWISLPLYVLLAAGICHFEPQRREGRKDKTIKSWRRACGQLLRLCGEKPFCRGWRSPCAIAVILAMLALNGLSLHAYYTDFEKEQWDDAAALVAERVEPGDLILFNATWMQIPFDYYFHRLSAVPVVEHGVPVDLFGCGILEPKMAQSDLSYLQDLVGGHDRVWLVYSHNWYTDPQGLIPPALEKELDLQGRWEFYGVRVWLYTASPD